MAEDPVLALVEEEPDGEVWTVDVPRLLREAVSDIATEGSVAVILRDQGEGWHVVTSSSEQARRLAVAHLAHAGGLGSFRFDDGASAAMAGAAPACPEMRSASRGTGIRMLHVLPLRSGRCIVGALCVFLTGDTVTHVTLDQLRVLADLAGVAIGESRRVTQTHRRVYSLQRTLEGRITLEQAKGMIAERAGFDVATAFTHLVRYARAYRLSLWQIATDLVSGQLSSTAVCGARGADEHGEGEEVGRRA
jgi:hypothetical protein